MGVVAKTSLYSPDRARQLRDWLLETERWPAARLRDYQSERLRELVAHARKHVPFHRERLRAHGEPELDRLTIEEVGALPVMQRGDLQSHSEALTAAWIPPEHGARKETMTSGSTGTPLRAGTTALALSYWHAFTLRDHLWHKRDFSRTLCVIRAVGAREATWPHGKTSPGWGLSTDVLYPTGPGKLLQVTTDIRDQATWLLRNRPGYLLGYPSNLLWLAEHFSRHGVDLPGLLEVRTFGEYLPDGLHPAVRDAWGVDVVDAYSSNEVGYIAFQCPEHQHYHVQSENVIVEVLDDGDRPCRPGHIGRVVVTVLWNYAMPLIRYDHGDFAEQGDGCDCGRTLPVIRRIVGRARNLVRTPDGRRIWPRFGYEEIMGVDAIRRLQFVQNDSRSIDVQMVLTRPLTPEEVQCLQAHWRGTFDYPFEFVMRPVEDIPRSKGGKFEDVVCNLP